MKIGIVGYGKVGRHLDQLFMGAGLETCVYDKYLPGFSSDHHKDAVQECDAAFIAVPTPSGTDGQVVLDHVEDAVSWLLPPICIKSTIVPGTTDRLCAMTGKRIVFSPEYVGETPFHRYRRSLDYDVVAVGGAPDTVSLFGDIYKRALGPVPRYIFTTAINAELAKYMENCFFATKVAFVAQFYLLAQGFGADFDQVREIWVSDQRVGLSHSIVVDRPGFGGRCLPKDLSAIIEAGKRIADVGLLEAVLNFNRALRPEEGIPAMHEAPEKLASADLQEASAQEVLGEG